MKPAEAIYEYTRWCEENWNLGDDELSSKIRHLLKLNDEIIAKGEMREYYRGEAKDIQKARAVGCRTFRELRIYNHR